MSKEVSFRVKIEGSDSVKVVTANTEDLGNAIDEVTDKAKRLDKTIIESSAWSQIIDGVNNAIGQLNAVMASLTSGYAAQIEAEAKLATAMRNTMDATDEEIQGIKDFIEEQQRSGIVAADVQAAASQELATYLGLSSSLKTIIPTMNDMIAQQLGLGASAESATQIASMLGKVMNGQTEALSRYGYKFNEAQKEILQFGDESERAAVLCQVIQESVGGMNRELAKTDVGKQQQMANRLDDIRDRLGAIVQKAQPAMQWLTAVGNTAGSILKLKTAIDALGKVEIIAAANAKVQAVAQKLLSKAGYEAAAGTMALKVATAALYATLTLGISLAIEGLVLAFGKLSRAGRDAAEEIDNAGDAQRAYQDASLDVRLALAEETLNLEYLIKKKKDASQAVADLNSKYGSIFGAHKTASEWYDVLTQKSAAYAKQLGYEAQAKVIASQKAAMEMELEGKRKALAQQPTYLSHRDSKGKVVPGGVLRYENPSEAAALNADINTLEQGIEKLGTDFNTCVAEMRAAAEELGEVTATSAADTISKASAGMADDITNYRKAVEGAVEVSKAFGDSQSESAVRLRAMESGITNLIRKYGLENEAVKALYHEYVNLLRVRTAGVLPSVSNKVPKAQAQTGKGFTVENFFEKLNSKESKESLENVQSMIGSLSSMMSGLGDVVNETAGSWLSWGANILRAVAQSLPAIAAVTAAHEAAAAAALKQGIAESAAFSALGGPILAITAAATVAAAVMGIISSLPKLANGALVSGPSVVQVGEYAGAANNPEVIAPLSKLQNIISPSFGAGQVEFIISGHALKGILKKINRLDERTGRI